MHGGRKRGMSDNGNYLISAGTGQCCMSVLGPDNLNYYLLLGPMQGRPEYPITSTASQRRGVQLMCGNERLYCDVLPPPPPLQRYQSFPAIMSRGLAHTHTHLHRLPVDIHTDRCRRPRFRSLRSSRLERSAI